MKTEKLRLPTYGGQALIEGVLMRGGKFLAAAYRKPDGEIIVEIEELGKIYQSPLRKIPFLRGLIILWDALGLGTKYLTKSANYQTEVEEEKIEGPALYNPDHFVSDCHGFVFLNTCINRQRTRAMVGILPCNSEFTGRHNPASFCHTLYLGNWKNARCS